MHNGLNFFQKLFASLFGSNDPDAEKKRTLKLIAKNVSKSKFKFYKPQNKTVEVQLAKFIYEVYKAVFPAQAMFQTTTVNAIKAAVIDRCLSEKQKAALEELNEEAIIDLSKSMTLPELQSRIKENFNIVATEFRGGTADKTDSLFQKLMYLKNFCEFDFYFFLRKFDSSLREKDFSLTPHFQPINASYVSEDIEKFIECAWVLPFDADWSDMFALLKDIKGIEPIAPNMWKKILSKLLMLKDSHIFEWMLQLINDDPYLVTDIKFNEEHIASKYLEQIQKQVEEALKKVQQNQDTSKINSLLMQIFGRTEIPELKNYTKSAAANFEKKNIGTYKYGVPLSYLKEFLLNFVKTELRELSDILLVRGKWIDPGQATAMSECFHQLLDCCDKLIEFDRSLAEDVDIGLKLKTMLPRAERDKDVFKIIQTTLKDVNNEAVTIITKAVKNAINYDKELKLLIEDLSKYPSCQMLMNWEELDKYASRQLRQTCVGIYKKIYYLVNLMQNFPLVIEK